MGDVNREYYRSKAEEMQWKDERDPLKNLASWLTASEFAEAALFDQIQHDVEAEVTAAVEFALNSPFPHPDEVNQHVYA